jgi:hypothetical protein
MGLSGGHVDGIYSSGVGNRAGEFSPSQPTAANPFFKGTTDYFSGALPISVRWIKRSRNGHERVSRISNGDVEREGQADITHFYPDVIGDLVDRVLYYVALCVESIVCRWVVIMFDGVHMVVLQDVKVFIVSNEILVSIRDDGWRVMRTHQTVR